MILPLERDELLSRWEGWRDFAEAPALEQPERLSAKQIEQLSEDRRGLVRAAKRVLPTDQDVELLIVIDQFEELFTLTEDDKLRRHFIDNLLSAATDPRLFRRAYASQSSHSPCRRTRRLRSRR